MTTGSIRRIGFIGLGAMGLPMAQRLIQAGFTVRSAVHRNQDAGKKFRDSGGILFQSFPEAVQSVDLVLSIVSDDQALDELYGDQAFFKAIPKDTIILEMTSCAPKTLLRIVKRYQKKTKNFVDAPVSGGVSGATNGTLTIFAAGERELLERLDPVFTVLGKTIPLEKIGDGKAVKAVNQMLAAVNMLAVAEAYVLTQKLGLDPERVYQIIKESSGGSYVFTNKFMKVARKDYSGGFKFRLMKKDLGIAVREAKGLRLPILKLADTLYGKFKGQEDMDYSVLATLYDSQLKHNQ
ncbi:MAG: NAD(P)-dependent oxidoreductase [Spirochaetes bacterium]|nr:NAD(P)-dependent oxidoreductase [Spirochaetota bacterium]